MSTSIWRLVSKSLQQSFTARLNSNHRNCVLLLNNQARAWHSSPQLLQVQKEKPDESTTDIDVQRERPYAHLTFGQKGNVQ